MAILSVRIPKDIEKSLPRKARSAWVIDAVRQKLRKDRALALGLCAAENAERDLEILKEWEHATAPLPDEPQRRRK